MKTVLSILEFPFIALSRLGTRPRNEDANESGAMGERLDSGDPLTISPEDLDRHCYILGATGCGKTSAVLKLIAHDLEAMRSVAVVDLRGDLAQGVLSLCASMKIDPKRVKLLDLREKERIQGFNPLSGAGEPHIRALHFLDVLAKEADSWGVQLEETMRNALLALAEAGMPPTRLSDLLFDEAFLSGILPSIGDETVRAFWERYLQLSPEKRQAWALPVMNKATSLFATPSLRQMLGSNAPLDLGKAMSEKGSILLVSLAVDELHRTSRMVGSLVVSSIAREAMARISEPEFKRNPVRLYIDEFENMASEAFESIVAEGRRFKLSLVLSHQTLSQLAPRLKSVIRNNAGLQIVFQCGYEDAVQISRELREGIDAASLRSLGVGEAYLVQRSGEAELVRFSWPGRLAPSSETAEYRKIVLNAVPKDSPESKPLKKKPKAKSKPKASKIDAGDWL